MIRAGIFEDVSSVAEIFKSVGQWFSHAATWLFAPVQWVIDWWPMAGHFLYFVLFFLLCAVIAYFLPFRWVRASLFLAIVIFAAFLLGEIVDFRWHLAAAAGAAAAAAAAAASKPKPKPKPQPPPRSDRWFG